MIFLDTLKVIKFTNTEIILDLRDNDNIKNLFNDIDGHIIELIKERKLVKTYELKKFTYVFAFWNRLAQNFRFEPQSDRQNNLALSVPHVAAPILSCELDYFFCF